MVALLTLRCGCPNGNSTLDTTIILLDVSDTYLAVRKRWLFPFSRGMWRNKKKQWSTNDAQGAAPQYSVAVVMLVSFRPSFKTTTVSWAFYLSLAARIRIAHALWGCYYCIGTSLLFVLEQGIRALLYIAGPSPGVYFMSAPYCRDFPRGGHTSSPWNDAVSVHHHLSHRPFQIMAVSCFDATGVLTKIGYLSMNSTVYTSTTLCLDE